MRAVSQGEVTSCIFSFSMQSFTDKTQCAAMRSFVFRKLLVTQSEVVKFPSIFRRNMTLILTNAASQSAQIFVVGLAGIHFVQRDLHIHMHEKNKVSFQRLITSGRSRP